MKVEKTGRGFEIVTFSDCGGNICSLQQSSMVGNAPDAWDRPGTSAVWLGCNHARERMHLNREMVAALIPHLQAWLQTGSLSLPTPDSVTGG